MTEQCTPDGAEDGSLHWVEHPTEGKRAWVWHVPNKGIGDSPGWLLSDDTCFSQGYASFRNWRYLSPASPTADTELVAALSELAHLRTTIEGQALTLQDSSETLAMVTARVKVLEEALRPFAAAASAFLFSLGPNGIDDGLTVDVSVACRPERETTLSTTDFSNAAAALNASAGETGQ